MPLMPAGRLVLFREAIDGAADMRAPLSLALYKRQIARNWLTSPDVEW
jgi:hypothetical protein